MAGLVAGIALLAGVMGFERSWPGAVTGGEAPSQVRVSAESAATQPGSPEDELWEEIQALEAEPAATQPFGAWFEAAARRREVLVEKLQLYLTLYPGGRWQVEVVRLELAALHELGGLRGGEFGPLCRRVEQYLGDYGAEHPVVWEAAYWEILCRRLERRVGTTQPTSAAVLEPDQELVAAYREYVARFPRSRHVPQMVLVLFEDARRSGKRAEMRRLVEIVEEGFPEHVVAWALAGQLKREEVVGRVFWLADERLDGSRLDTRKFVGQPVVIVVWSASSAEARQCVREVEQFRQAHREVRVVGVNLDESGERMAAACAELGVEWPQFNDGLGAANRFARTWGVRRVPCVFVIDRSGRLVGWAQDGSWRERAREALGR